jgi:hypothetical protein
MPRLEFILVLAPSSARELSLTKLNTPRLVTLIRQSPYQMTTSLTWRSQKRSWLIFKRS